jgi:cytoskeletal protein CcmA (bactofilin family)
LRVASERSKIEGKMKGLLISREVELKGEGEIFGGVIAEKFSAGGGQECRWECKDRSGFKSEYSL